MLGFAVLASSCTNTGPSKPEIRYMAWGNPQQLALEKRLVEEFNEANPDMHVRLFQVPQSNYLNKMIVMLASHTAPEVIRVDQMNFPQLVKRDYFRSLDDLVAKDTEFNPKDFFPQAIDECKYKGKLYGVNVLFGGVILYYNKDLVKKAGLEEPFAVWKRGEWTWDKYLEYAKAMTVRRPDGRYVSFGASIPTNPQIYPSIWGFGGEMMDSAKEHVVLDQPKAVEAFQFWRDLRFVHQCAPTPSQAANAAFNFETGKLGMQFDWMGLTPRLRQAATHFAWDVVPIPKGPAGGQTCTKGNQLIMSADTKRPDLAWRFMKYMVSEKVERILGVEMRRTFPTRKAVAYSSEYQNSDKPPFNMRAFTFAVETGKPMPITSRWGDWTGQFNSGMDALWNNRTSSAAEATKDAVGRAERILAIPEGL